MNKYTKFWYGTRYPTVSHNYCRNVDNDAKGPWCFTNANGKEWEYCDIPSCQYESDGDANDSETTKSIRQDSASAATSSTPSDELTCGLRCLNSNCDPIKG